MLVLRIYNMPVLVFLIVVIITIKSNTTVLYMVSEVEEQWLVYV